MIPERQVPSNEEIVVLEDNEQPSTSTQIRSNPQHQITQYFRRSPPIRKVEQIDRQVLKMIAKGHRSFRIVE